MWAILIVLVAALVNADQTFSTPQEAVQAALQTHENGDGASAIAMLRQIATQVPEHLDVLMALGALEHTYANVQEAIQIYERIILINPQR
jgi:hypothetical protein